MAGAQLDIRFEEVGGGSAAPAKAAAVQRPSIQAEDQAKVTRNQNLHLAELNRAVHRIDDGIERMVAEISRFAASARNLPGAAAAVPSAVTAAAAIPPPVAQPAAGGSTAATNVAQAASAVPVAKPAAPPVVAPPVVNPPTATPVASPAAAAATGTAARAVASLAAGAAAALPAIAAVAAGFVALNKATSLVQDGFELVKSAAVALSEKVKEQFDRLGRFSADIQAANARITATNIQRDIMQAQLIGERVAAFREQQNRLYNVIERIRIAIESRLIDAVLPLMKIAAKALETLVKIGELIWPVIEALSYVLAPIKIVLEKIYALLEKYVLDEQTQVSKEMDILALFRNLPEMTVDWDGVHWGANTGQVPVDQPSYHPMPGVDLK